MRSFWLLIEAQMQSFKPQLLQFNREGDCVAKKKQMPALSGCQCDDKMLLGVRTAKHSDVGEYLREHHHRLTMLKIK